MPISPVLISFLLGIVQKRIIKKETKLNLFSNLIKKIDSFLKTSLQELFTVQYTLEICYWHLN